MRIVSGKVTRSFSVFEELLKQDVEEIMLVRIPQLPPSRSWGSYPVASVEEYQHRLPNDPAIILVIALVCTGAVASCQPAWIRHAHSGVIQ